MKFDSKTSIEALVAVIILMTLGSIAWPLISTAITDLTGNLSGVSGASLISATLLGLLFVVGLFFGIYKLFAQMWK